MDNTTRGPSPIYLLAGGGRSTRRNGDALLTQALASSGVPHPSVAYVGAASDDDESFFQMLSHSMRRCGAGQVTLAPLVGRRARPEKARAILDAADMVFISGGDVEAGMEVLEEKQVLPFLRQIYEGGRSFLGISAGSIMLAMQWILWEDPDDNTTASVFPCMGFAPLLCDTHGEAEGWEELQSLLRMAPDGTLGYGIPSGAGLRVGLNGTLEAMGDPVHRYTHQAGKVVRVADLPPQRP